MISLMMPRHLSSALRALAIAFTFAFAYIFCLPLRAQSIRAGSLNGLINQLLPDGAIPSDLRVNPDQRKPIILKLKVAQSTALGPRAQQVAFILAALNAEYERNRDYLLHSLSGCNFPQIRYGCDEMTGEYLIYLYRHGHKDILAPLLKTSIDGYNAAATEALGADFGEMIEKSPDDFLHAVNTLPLPTQRRVCSFAGSGDGGGLGADGLLKARRNLHRIGGEVALRCLAEIEAANKPD